MNQATEDALAESGLGATVLRNKAIARGTLDVATNAVEELTGRPAEDVRSFLARHKAAVLAPVGP
ncbi:hypothetical protein WMF20_39990 [Sorangium sp. So ce834]|uniref:hypothetical protein n=1 Tax=Sorangium sp. So ce834 TaxID=3133321 RepID=UPI003F63FB3B